MPVTRRQSLGLLGSALALPYVLRTDLAFAAPRLRRVGPLVKVGASQPGGQAFLNLAPFENSQSGFIATWINYLDAAASARDYCQYFTHDRRARTGPIEIGGGTGSARLRVSQQPRPVTFPDGTALVFFAAFRAGATGNELYVQRMSAARTKVGIPIRVNTSAPGNKAIIFATRLTTGNVLVVWQNAAGTIDSIDTHCRVVNKQGVGIFPERIATKERTGQQIPKSICSLAGGNAVLSYVSVDLVAKTWRVLLQRLSQSGLRLGEPILVKAGSSDRPFGAAAVVSSIRSGVSGAPQVEAISSVAFNTIVDRPSFSTPPPDDVNVGFGSYRSDGTKIQEQVIDTVEAEPQDSDTAFAWKIVKESGVLEVIGKRAQESLEAYLLHGANIKRQVEGPFILADPSVPFVINGLIGPFIDGQHFNFSYTEFGTPFPGNVNAVMGGFVEVQ